MPPTPKYIQDLTSQGQLHKEQLANLRKETDDLGKKADVAKEVVAEIRQDIAVINQKIAELSKRIEIWDGRLWSFVVLAIATLLSLASGLVVTVVTLAKK